MIDPGWRCPGCGKWLRTETTPEQHVHQGMGCPEFSYGSSFQPDKVLLCDLEDSWLDAKDPTSP